MNVEIYLKWKRILVNYEIVRIKVNQYSFNCYIFMTTIIVVMKFRLKIGTRFLETVRYRVVFNEVDMQILQIRCEQNVMIGIDDFEKLPAKNDYYNVLRGLLPHSVHRGTFVGGNKIVPLKNVL